MTRIIPAGGTTGAIEVEVTAPAWGWLAARPLTGEERELILFFASLSALYADMREASPEAAVFVGLVVMLVLRELTRRVLKPSE